MNLRPRSFFYKFFKSPALENAPPVVVNSPGWSSRQLVYELGRDLRGASRSFLQKPLFPTIAVLLIAIGVGLNTAFFSFVNGRALIPRAVKDPGSLFEIEGVTAGGRTSGLYSFREYVSLREQNQVFQQVLADHRIKFNTPDGPLTTYLVSGNYFDSLGIQLLQGRPIQPGDDQLSSPPVVVLGQAIWRSRFAADPQIVGQRIELASRSFTVIGVAAHEVEGLDHFPTDLWVPLSTRALFTDAGYVNDASDIWLRVTGHLKPGITNERAESSLEALLPKLTADRPQNLVLSAVELESFATYGELKEIPWLGMSPIIVVFGLVLLIACGSIGRVQLARILSQRREIGESFARGASRGRIVRQLVTESLPLIVVGGGLGLVFSHGLNVLLRRVILDPETAGSRVFAVTLDFRILCFAFLLSLLAGVMVGLIPALQATRPGRISILKGEDKVLGGQPRKRRLVHGLAVIHCAVILFILVLAGSLIRHQMELSSTPLGFDVSQGLFVGLGGGADIPQFRKTLSEIPGVISVANQMAEPLYNYYPSVSISSSPEGPGRLISGYNLVSPEYFKSLGIPLLLGRVFTSQEAGSKAEVAVISQPTAQRLWPGQDPIGKQLAIGLDPARTVQVVGVVGGVVNKIPVDGMNANFVYLPLDPAKLSGRFLVRVEGDLAAMQRAIRTELSKALPIAEFELYPLADLINWASYRYKVAAGVGAALGIFCLLLASLGIYGVMVQPETSWASKTSAGSTPGRDRQTRWWALLLGGGRLVLVSIIGGLILTLGSRSIIPDPVINAHLTDPLVLTVAIGSLLTIALPVAILPLLKGTAGYKQTQAAKAV
jgi:putative ABC transport system permease protein